MGDHDGRPSPSTKTACKNANICESDPRWKGLGEELDKHRDGNACLGMFNVENNPLERNSIALSRASVQGLRSPGGVG